MQAAITGIPVASLAFYYSEIMLAEYRNALEQVCLDHPRDFYLDQVARLLSEVERRGTLIHPTITLTDHFPVANPLPNNRIIQIAPPGWFERILFSDC